MIRAIQVLCCAGLLLAAGCSRSNDAELRKARAEADAARAEAAKAKADADAARTELAKLKGAQAETAAKPAPQTNPGEDPHSLRIQSPEQIKVNGLEVEVNGVVNPNAGVTRIMWNWGDGTPEEKLGFFPAKHRYEKPGTYQIRVMSYDDAGKTSTRTTSVTVVKTP